MTERIPRERLRAGGRWRSALVLGAFLCVVAAAIAGHGSGGEPAARPSLTDASEGSSAPEATVQSPTPTAAFQSPASSADLESALQTAHAFVEAWGKGDWDLANAYRAPERRDEDQAVSMDTPPPDEFQNIQCRPTAGIPWDVHPSPAPGATAVVVWCKWDVREDWGGLLAGGWSMYVWLVREPPDPWLVVDFGN